MFFKIILFIVLGFYLLGIIGKLWLRWFIAKKQREFAQGKRPGGFYYSTSFGGNNSHKTKTKKTGELNIEQLKPSQKKVNTKVGDYVDFEEVKE